MPSKSGRGRGLQDSIDSIHTDTTLTDAQKRSIQNIAQEAANAIGATDRASNNTVTFIYGFGGTAANPSLSFSITA